MRTNLSQYESGQSLLSGHLEEEKLSLSTSLEQLVANLLPYGAFEYGQYGEERVYRWRRNQVL